MRYLTFKEKEEYSIVFLVPSIQRDSFEKEYISLGLNKEDILILDLYYDKTKKKTPVADMKQYLNEEILPTIHNFKCKYAVVTDAEYFKVLSKKVKADPNIGYVLDSPFGSFKVLYIPNTQSIFFNPEPIKKKIKLGIEALKAHINGTYKEPGESIIYTEYYPESLEEIKSCLQQLIDKNIPLTCDIETFSLKHYDAGIASITLCWNKHEGIAFAVDNHETKERNEPVRELLRYFFEHFNNTLIYHNIAFDVYVLIYQLYMKNLLDTEGLLNGIDILLKNWEDTKLITYLATNSCARNELGLKAQAQEFAGNYAQDEIGDVTKIPLDQLLRYNLVDGLSTWYVYEKYYQKMIDDQQEDIYRNLFKPATVDIIQMQLTGLPMDMDKVQRTKEELLKDRNEALDKILNSEAVKSLTYQMKEEWVALKNATLKKKKVTLADAKESFNPNSTPQMQRLLYQELGLPVINLTESKQPAVDTDTLKDLINHTDNEDYKILLQALIDYSAVEKILSSFIPAFEKAQNGLDGRYYLFGNFNLGGTVSGRLSSSKPNLQQIPATGTKYAKPIKKCFSAPEGWIFCGLDFNALEDHISALTTKDKNKLAVYIHGYDGHCLRAYSYWGDKMPDIQEELKKAQSEDEKVNIINSIKGRYKTLRQASKTPTFALTYQGTYRTLMSKCGFSEEEAKHIEKQYHDLYKESDEWVAKQINQASHDGYVTAAFGLRVRTPLLKQTIRKTRKTPYEAEAEGRTAGNALGQSWCLLNNRAGIEFNKAVRNSPYRLLIKPCAQIHDAQYFLVKDDPEVILWANNHLVHAVQWQDDPAIWHDQVKLGGEFSMFYPDWAHELSIPNDCTEEQLYQLTSKYLEELDNGN